MANPLPTTDTLKVGSQVFRIWPGGTGPCWNLGEDDEADTINIHICNLEAFILALLAYRETENYKRENAKWSM